MIYFQNLSQYFKAFDVPEPRKVTKYKAENTFKLSSGMQAYLFKTIPSFH